MRISDIMSEQSRLELELAKLSRELSGRPVKEQKEQQPISNNQHQHQHQDFVNIIDNSVSSPSSDDNKKRSRGRPRKDIGTIVSSSSSSSSSSNININGKHHDENLRINYDVDDGTYYFVDCGRVFICNSEGMLFDIKTRELVGWRNTYLNRVDFVDII
jgi:hypothetical protein